MSSQNSVIQEVYLRSFSSEEKLSWSDTHCILTLIHQSLACKGEKDIGELIGSLKNLIQCDFSIAGFIKIDEAGSVNEYEFINVNYPDEWFNAYIAKKYYLIDPIIEESFSKFKPWHWTGIHNASNTPKDIASIAERFGICEGYSYGLKESHGREGSIFLFSGKVVPRQRRTDIILAYIIPHFHQALSYILGRQKQKKRVNISMREREVLNWLSKGKSSWDISVILGISERTVNFHVYNIMQKFDAVNRLQVIALASRLGFIDFE